MLTLTQINAETDTGLTEEHQMVLEMLVKAYPEYRQAPWRYANLSATIDTVQANQPSPKIKALKAVVTALGGIPSLVVESQGTDKAPSFFSTVSNWRELAQTVLDLLYEVPYVAGPQGYIVVQRRIEDLIISDSGTVIITNCGS